MKTLELDDRLQACADFVRDGTTFADIGTDHGYLPIWLLLHGRVSKAIAADIRPGPLQSARRNAERWGVAGQLVCRQSDGLRAFVPGEVRDIAVAGMGGEMILNILERAPWAREAGMRLILQPMTRAALLRRGLAALGLGIVRERAACAGGRVYTALCVEPAQPQLHGPLWEHMGALDAADPLTALYARRVFEGLRKRRDGLRREHDEAGAQALDALMREIEETYFAK